MEIQGGLPVNMLLYCSATIQLKVQDAQEGEKWWKSGVRSCTGRTGTHFAHIGWQRVNSAFSPKNFIQAKEIQTPS